MQYHLLIAVLKTTCSTSTREHVSWISLSHTHPNGEKRVKPHKHAPYPRNHKTKVIIKPNTPICQEVAPREKPKPSGRLYVKQTQAMQLLKIILKDQINRSRRRK